MMRSLLASLLATVAVIAGPNATPIDLGRPRTCESCGKPRSREASCCPRCGHRRTP